MIAFYPGAFKPPHRGHFNVVKSLLDGSYNGSIYDKDNYKETGASLLSGNSSKKPDIDKVIVFVGAGERNGITKEESMSIWKVYSEFLGNVEILDGGSNPMFAAKDYAQDNPKEDFVSVTGIRGEKDFVDLRRVTTYKNAPNVKGLALAAAPGSGIRATDFRNNILSGNLDKILDFFPEELSREQILNILTDLKDKIVAEVLSNSIEGFIDNYFDESTIDERSTAIRSVDRNRLVNLYNYLVNLIPQGTNIDLIDDKIIVKYDLPIDEILNENKVLDTIKGLGQETLDNLKAKITKIFRTGTEEYKEFGQAFRLIGKKKKGEKLTSEEEKLIKNQSKDFFKVAFKGLGALSGIAVVAAGLPITVTIATIISIIGFLDLDDELLKYTDSSPETARGLTKPEEDKSNFKNIGGVKYIKYDVVAPYLDQADAVAESTQTKLELKDYIGSLLEYMLDQNMNITPLPEIVTIKDKINAANFFGRTAYYSPSDKKVALYTYNRHPKDIVRSCAHEMIHHMQNLEGRLKNITTTNTNEDENLEELEKEAYLLGNITFRNWEDSLKNEGTLLNENNEFYSGTTILKENNEPKKGTGKKPKGSSRRLYTDEDPKDTVSVKFSTRQDIVDTLSKKSFKAKSHARQSQIINLIHQRVRAALGRTKDPVKKKRLQTAFKYIKDRKEASKKKTKRLNKSKK